MIPSGIQTEDELQAWLFQVLHGHGVPADSPREETSPAYFIVELYPNLSRVLRQDVETAIIRFLREHCTGSSNSWSNDALEQLLLLTGAVLCQSSLREEAISYLRSRLKRISFPAREHFFIVQALIGLKVRQEPEFWHDLYIFGGDKYAPLVVEGLAILDEATLFDWLPKVEWNAAVEGALAGIFPSILLEHGTGRTVSSLSRVFPNLSRQAKAAIESLLVLEGISTVGLDQFEPDQAMETMEHDRLDLTLGAEGVEPSRSSSPLAVLAEHPHLHGHAIARTVENYLLVLLADDRIEAPVIADLFRRAHEHLNGHDRSEIGSMIGEFAGTQEAKGRLSEEQMKILAKGFLESFSDEKSSRQLAAAHLVRSRTQKLAELKWRRASRLPLRNLMYDIKDLGGPARGLLKVANRFRINRLLVAESEFHEDRIICNIFKHVCDEVGLPVTIAARRWGNLETHNGQADIGLVNVGYLERPSASAVYLYKGYYIFAKRSWLASLYSDEASIPHAARQFLERLSGGSDVGVTCHDETDRLARAWIAICGGLARQGDGFGFPEVTELLRQRAEEVAPIKVSGRTPTPDQSFGQQMGAFLRGDLDVFMGGAMHARLLKRWWVDLSDEVVELLSPQDLAALLHSRWPPCDVPQFGDRIQNLRGREKTEFSAAVLRLYRTIGSLLKTVTETRERNESSAQLLAAFSSMIAPSVEDSDGREWSFVSDLNDTASLLLLDNEFLS